MTYPVVVSRKDALIADLTHYFTGIACRHGHVALRRTRCGVCVECSSEYKKRLYATNKQKVQKYNQQYYLSNREFVLDLVRHYARTSKDKISQRTSSYYAANKDRIKQRVQAYRKANRLRVASGQKRYRALNPHKRNALGAAYRAHRKQAMPPWANSCEILEFYEDARRLRITGVRWHVDHIVPLRHPLVCGLHVEYNLQLLPEQCNLSKGNTFNVEEYVHDLPKI